MQKNILNVKKYKIMIFWDDSLPLSIRIIWFSVEAKIIVLQSFNSSPSFSESYANSIINSLLWCCDISILLWLMSYSQFSDAWNYYKLLCTLQHKLLRMLKINPIFTLLYKCMAWFKSKFHTQFTILIPNNI